MPVFLTGLGLALGAVYALAAWRKVTRPDAPAEMLATFGLPAGAVRSVSQALPGVEAAIAVMLVLPGLTRAGALASAGFLVGASAVIMANLLAGRRPVCGCFGTSARPVSAATVARNAGLVAVSLLVFAGTPSTSPLLGGVVPELTLAALAATAMTYATIRRARRRPADPRTLLVRTGDGQLRPFGELVGAQRTTTVIFVSAGCGPCRELLQRLGDLGASDSADGAVLLAFRDGAEELSHVPAHRTVVGGAALFDAYNVRATPTVVTVTASATLTARPAVGLPECEQRLAPTVGRPIAQVALLPALAGRSAELRRRDAIRVLVRASSALLSAAWLYPVQAEAASWRRCKVCRKCHVCTVSADPVASPKCRRCSPRCGSPRLCRQARRDRDMRVLTKEMARRRLVTPPHGPEIAYLKRADGQLVGSSLGLRYKHPRRRNDVTWVVYGRDHSGGHGVAAIRTRGTRLVEILAVENGRVVQAPTALPVPSPRGRAHPSAQQPGQPPRCNIDTCELICTGVGVGCGLSSGFCGPGVAACAILTNVACGLLGTQCGYVCDAICPCPQGTTRCTAERCYDPDQCEACINRDVRVLCPDPCFTCNGRGGCAPGNGKPVCGHNESTCRSQDGTTCHCCSSRQTCIDGRCSP